MRFFLIIIGAIIGLVASSEIETEDWRTGELLELEDSFDQEFSKSLMDREDGNVAYSAASLWLLLAQAASGARGQTEDEMETALRLPQFGYWDDSYRHISFRLRESMFTGMYMGQQIFLGEWLKPKQEFRTKLKSKFGAHVRRVDFSDATNASRVINSWFAEMTSNHVTNVTKPMEGMAPKMVLVSTVYVNTTWRWPFYGENTKYRPFRLNSGRKVYVRTMCAQAKWRKAEMPGIDADFIHLQFETNRPGAPRMIIVLPGLDADLLELRRKINELSASQLWNNAPKEGESRQLCLPKFKIESKIQLRPILNDMGINATFSPNEADFSGINDSKPLSVSNLIQKVIIEVGENGRYANESNPVLKDSPEPINVDRPFFGFILTDRPYPVKLLSFRYTDPKV